MIAQVPRDPPAGHATLNYILFFRLICTINFFAVALEVVMINPHRFYRANALQNIPNDSDSEDDLSVDKSSSHSLSHSSSSKSFESDSKESLPDSSNSNHNDEQNDSSDEPHLPGTWHAVDGTYRKQFVFADDAGIFGFSGIAPDELKPIDVHFNMVTDDIYCMI